MHGSARSLCLWGIVNSYVNGALENSTTLVSGARYMVSSNLPYKMQTQNCWMWRRHRNNIEPRTGWFWTRALGSFISGLPLRATLNETVGDEGMYLKYTKLGVDAEMKFKKERVFNKNTHGPRQPSVEVEELQLRLTSKRTSETSNKRLPAGQKMSFGERICGEGGKRDSKPLFLGLSCR